MMKELLAEGSKKQTKGVCIFEAFIIYESNSYLLNRAVSATIAARITTADEVHRRVLTARLRTFESWTKSPCFDACKLCSVKLRSHFSLHVVRRIPLCFMRLI